VRPKENLFQIQITVWWAFKAIAAVYFSVAGSNFTHLDTAKFYFNKFSTHPKLPKKISHKTNLEVESNLFQQIFKAFLLFLNFFP